MRGARVFILGLTVTVWLNTRAFAADPTSDFNFANDLYAQGKFAEAAGAYEKALQSGAPSAALYFNLGNAFFKSGRSGQAIAAYREAERIAPRDPDIRANLQFVRDQVQGPTSAPRLWERAFRTLTVNEWTVLASVPFWIWLVLLMSIQFRPAWKPAVGTYLWASGMATLALSVCVGITLSASSTKRAVVIKKDVSIRFGPLDEAASAVNVHDGAEVRVLDQKDQWLLVRVGNRNGWVRRDQVFLPENFHPRSGVIQ